MALPTDGLLGYDCTTRGMNYTVLSFLNAGDCELPNVHPKTQDIRIQLLQTVDFQEIKIGQCKISIFRTAYQCNYFGNLEPVDQGEAEFVQDTNRDLCQQLHLTGTFALNEQHVISGLTIVSTVTHAITLAGDVAECKGGAYTDPYGSWSDALVKALVKITLIEGRARVTTNSDRIDLPCGTICQFSDAHCLDMLNRHTLWEALPEDRCHLRDFQVVYDGLATRITDQGSDLMEPVYTRSSKDVTFALAKKKEQNLCGYGILTTEHPKLLILEVGENGGFIKLSNNTVRDLDLFAYVNSKFVYVERHVRNQIK